MLQHPASGLLYSANNYGVLEFDGATWRLIAMPNGGVTRTLAVDARGQLWTGGSDEIAVLAPDARGLLHARSVLDRLPAAQREVGAVTLAASAPDGVYFGTARQVLLFGNDGRARTWTPPKPAASLTWLDSMLLIASARGELFTLRDNAISPLANPGKNAGPILAARAQAGGGWQLLTPQGPAHWAGPGAAITPVGEDNAALFATDPAHSAVFLADGRTAFGRVLGGMSVLDPAGRRVQKIDRGDGLPGNRVEQLFEDAEGGLWIAQRAGLSRVQLDSPYAKHGLAHGVEGRPRALHRHQGRLSIAHNEGAAWRDDTTGEFHPISGLATGLTRFVSIGSRLLGTSNAIYEVTPEMVTPLVRRGITPLVALPGTPPERPSHPNAVSNEAGRP